MYLGIEIGGTKLQLGVGAGDGSDLAALERLEVEPKRGAAGIIEQIEKTAAELIQRFGVQSIGIGFGGPVDSASGIVLKSHQVDGWDDFELAAWCDRSFGLPIVIGNDCDTAALAEAKYGAGWAKRSLLYVTVGTGIGGGFVVDGTLHGSGRPAVAEIGHLRPGLHADRPDSTVESLASGLGIAAAVKARISGGVALSFEARQRTRLRVSDPADGETTAMDDVEEEYKLDLQERAGGDIEQLTAKIIGQAAAEGNQIAIESVGHAAQVLGWAIAQVVTLLAPEVVVVGGGVSLIGEQLFFTPLREEVERYVFPPLIESYQIVPASLGELAVVHGAVALAVSATEGN